MMNQPISNKLSSQAERVKTGYQSQSPDTTPQVDVFGCDRFIASPFIQKLIDV